MAKKYNLGGYDEGYSAVPCFWGTEPGSLVSLLLRERTVAPGSHALDIGCGEGKNAAALADYGCTVDAVDCSALALLNGRKAFQSSAINWIEGDALQFPFRTASYDLIVCYGLLHCLQGEHEIARLIANMQHATANGGLNVICAFNDRSQDLSAHPGFKPALMSHAWYERHYRDWEFLVCTDSDLHETHPHNGIPHHHSLTRLIARRT